MPGDSCLVCGNTRSKDPSVSMYRFPKEQEKRRSWLTGLKLLEADVKDHHRICSRHFPDGEYGSPELSIGKRFASPKKQWTSRAKRAKQRELDKEPVSSRQSTPSSSRQSTPNSSRQVSPVREMSRSVSPIELRQSRSESPRRQSPNSE